ncbi:transposase, partial [Neisseria meningitidis]
MKNGSNCFRTIAQIWYYTLNIAAVNKKAAGASGIFCYACFNRERKYYSELTK